jgi:hypothetical protein
LSLDSVVVATLDLGVSRHHEQIVLDKTRFLNVLSFL